MIHVYSVSVLYTPVPDVQIAFALDGNNAKLTHLSPSPSLQQSVLDARNFEFLFLMYFPFGEFYRFPAITTCAAH